MSASRRALMGAALAFLVLAAACAPSEPTTKSILPATVNWDCAPWDGAAVTILVPVGGGDTVVISLWRDPLVKTRATFHFAEEYGPEGSAGLNDADGHFRQMIGTATIGPVAEGRAVWGRFSLKLDSGEKYEEVFLAEWGDWQPLCG